MADNNNPSNNPPAEDSKGNQPEGQPAANGGDGSSKPTVDAAELARRDQQSKKDQANNEKNDLEEQVEFLAAKEAERARDSYVSSLLSDTEKYPNVKPDDPMFKYATSKEEVEEIATTLQNRYADMQQDALRSVHTESDQSLTDEEIAEKEKEYEDVAIKEGRSTFGNFLDTVSRRKK